MRSDSPFSEARLSASVCCSSDSVIPGDARLQQFGKVEREATPAAADVEHAFAGLEDQLGGDVPLLGELGVVEGLVRPLEVGAAVLPVGIQEQRIEPLVEVIVMGDVAARAGAAD